MTYTRRLWALPALALALVLGACSTPDDLTASTLEPQFGTRGADSVEDVAFGKAGALYAVGTWNSSSEQDNYSGYYLYNQDAYLRRYDRSGNLMWEDFLEVEPAYENYARELSARAVATDASGNAIVAWTATYSYFEYVYDPSTDYGRYEHRYHGPFNYLSKYSPSGKKVWRISVGADLIKDSATDGSGNIYAVAGKTLTKYTAAGARSWVKTMAAEPEGVAVSSTNNVYIVRFDGSVVKYNSSGTQLFAKTGALDGDSATNYKIAVGLSDELFITGQYLTSDSWNCEAAFYIPRYAMRVYKLNASGARQWVRDAANGTLDQNPYCDFDDPTSTPGRLNVATDSAGNVYLAGFRNGASYDQDAFAAKYTRAGALSWVKGFGTRADDGATSIATYDGTEVFVGGVTEGYLVHRHLGLGDAFMREMNSSGAQVWTR